MKLSFKDYAAHYTIYHQEYITRLTYFISVPLIFFSSMIFFSFIKISIPDLIEPISISWFLILALLGIYFKLHKIIAMVAAPIIVIANYLASLIASYGISSHAFETFFLLFIAGWITQISGYFYSKEKPSMMDNISHVLVAALFVIAELFFYFGKLNDAFCEIYGPSNPKKDKKNEATISKDDSSVE